jgi:hypothetical protein
MIVPEQAATRHWLYQWMDEEGVKTVGNYVKAIRKKGSFERLRQLSDSAMSEFDARNPTGRPADSIIASRYLDLSGFLSCPCFECQIPTVDKVFRRVWHYFDSVIIAEEPLEAEFASGDDVYDLKQKVQLFLYLRNIGAEKHILFTNKVLQLCDEHFREHATQPSLGLDILFDKEFEKAAVKKLAAEGKFKIFEEDGSWGYEITHPHTGQLTGKLPHSDLSKRPSEKRVARAAFGKSCNALISDASAAQSLRVPLMQSAEHTWILRAADLTDSSIDETSVALNIQLPVLANVPLKELLRYREDNSASFVLFRDALRGAMMEQIKRSGSDSPEAIASAVVRDYIDPQVAKIEQELTVAKKTLARKVNAHIAVGSAAVGVGYFGNMHLLIGATVAAAAASITTIINKNADNKEPIENKPYYFLWKMRSQRRLHWSVAKSAAECTDSA